MDLRRYFRILIQKIKEEEKRKKRRKCLNFFIAEKSIAVINCELNDERSDSVRGAFVCFITESLSS